MVHLHMGSILYSAYYIMYWSTLVFSQRVNPPESKDISSIDELALRRANDWWPASCPKAARRLQTLTSNTKCDLFV